MAFQIPTAWAGQTTSYTTRQQVSLNGVTYEAINDISASQNNEPPSTDGVNWKAVAVTEIVDYNALVEGVRLQLNTTADEIYNSIPLFISLTEESFKTRLLLPQQLRRTTVTTTIGPDGESRCRIPGGVLRFELVRQKNNNFDSLRVSPYDNDDVEILGANREEYIRVLRASNTFNEDYYSFDTAVYYWDRGYLNFAPAYPAGTEIEIEYYRTIPKLGTQATVTDLDGNPINAAGQTEAEWLAAGNAPGTFVPEMRTVVTNDFLSIAPQMLLYGACLRAKPFLHDDDPMIKLWQEMYVAAEKELDYLIDQFKNNQAHTLFIQNTYAMQI